MITESNKESRNIIICISLIAVVLLSPIFIHDLIPLVIFDIVGSVVAICFLYKDTPKKIDYLENHKGV